ncbi:hypothetical protein [Nocardiopsis ansamitocini]|uniref:Uncharacterized protein n=1 Tax=Nocardiopsis ansamitocini TaxID=1670832 RepID=A0A9W6P479_9ACTN|nr:hypothetical protein [Nocardiopsis ansamitocini]GLU46797.1 hypothetical protein Nans01_11480 [Nocardiopsis ansamitocini]
MPKKRRRISAFFKILIALTLSCGVLVAVGFYVMRSVQPIDISPPPPSEGCVATTEEDTNNLEVEQAANASTVAGVAFSRTLPPQAVVIAYATVWQESKFYNIRHGDRDSQGLFQQRPSMAWGTPEQITDPVYSSAAFYDELVTIDGYTDMPVHEAAQAVQRSADGFAYDQHEPRSQAMTNAFTGAEGPAVHCWFDTDNAVVTDVEGAATEMERVFGIRPDQLDKAKDRQTGEMGWAMAQWAVAHAHTYGLNSVSYADRRWTMASGAQGWGESADPTPENEVVLG